MFKSMLSVSKNSLCWKHDLRIQQKKKILIFMKKLQKRVIRHLQKLHLTWKHFLMIEKFKTFHSLSNLTKKYRSKLSLLSTGKNRSKARVFHFNLIFKENSNKFECKEAQKKHDLMKWNLSSKEIFLIKHVVRYCSMQKWFHAKLHSFQRVVVVAADVDEIVYSLFVPRIFSEALHILALLRNL